MLPCSVGKKIRKLFVLENKLNEDGKLQKFFLINHREKALSIESQKHMDTLEIGQFLVRWIKLHVYV